MIAEEKRDQAKRLKSYGLNKDAARGINKHIGEHDWEDKLEQETRSPKQIAANSMMIPMLKICAE